MTELSNRDAVNAWYRLGFNDGKVGAVKTISAEYAALEQACRDAYQRGYEHARRNRELADRVEF